MARKSKVWYLENFNFFSELSPEDRDFICQNTVMRTQGKGETVYFQNDSANSVYFLKEGKISIERFTSTGENFLLAILEKGEIFGESSITKSSKRKEAAIVEEEATYCVMEQGNFRELLMKCPSLNIKFSQLLEVRLEKAQKRLEDVSFKKNRERIIEYLKETAVLSAESMNGNLVTINSLPHQKIAQLTSTNRQEVSNVFSDLRKNRIIDYNRKIIKILNFNKLEAYC
ncbi:Crp/Fnr family transcriptional regulator [Salinimicrobium sp. CDJ15-81-2]|nr:Crp/Fnr family transcriptional regulator [Salinimicrobium nanhaiense]